MTIMDSRRVALIVVCCVVIATGVWLWMTRREPQPKPRETQTVRLGDARLYPNSQLTPGAIDPAVTQDNIASTICMHGNSASVRPPSSVTRGMKRRLIEA